VGCHIVTVICIILIILDGGLRESQGLVHSIIRLLIIIAVIYANIQAHIDEQNSKNKK
jgi:hypothetical protein